MSRDIIKIYRSNKNCYAQFISIKDQKIKWSLSDSKEKGSKTEKAKILGEKIANKLKENKINSITFDRNKYKYHGRIKAVAEAIRNKGVTI